jgi:predicted glycosyltransferase involved in capsule biosynthesis
LAPLLRLPLGPLRKLRAKAWRGARSCNLAVWRSDLDRVDGFDAAYSGWGLEDSDLLIRLLRAGVRRKDGNFATGVLHLWHAESDRSRLPENQRRLDEILYTDRVRASAGLSTVRASAAEPAGTGPAGHR